MKGNCIMLTSPIKGNMIEGTIVGTPLPGTIMEIVPGVAPTNGRHSYRASQQANGLPRQIAVLLDDANLGVGPTTAYVAGTRGRLYFPVPGDELNMIVDVPGTGTGGSAETIGENLMCGADGHLTLAVGSPAAVPFQSMEKLADVPAGSQLTWCTYTGA